MFEDSPPKDCVARIVLCRNGDETYFSRLLFAYEASKLLKESHVVEAKTIDGRWILVDTVALAQAILDDDGYVRP